MKFVNVVVKGKTILELLEDAKAGDQIDLSSLVELDTNFIEALINQGEDRVYNNKLEEVKRALEKEKSLELQNLSTKMEVLVKENEQNKKLLEEKLKNEHQAEIQKLKEELRLKELKEESVIKEINSKKDDEARALKDEFNKEIDKLNTELALLKQKSLSDIEAISLKSAQEVKNIEVSLNNKYISLDQEYRTFRSNAELKLSEAKLTIESQFKDRVLRLENDIKLNNLEHEKKIVDTESKLNEAHLIEISKLKESMNKELQEKDEQINQLLRTKGAYNVKQTGENLETWCDNEILTYMQNGFFNCTWTKDNDAVKEDGETKGSKADFIFRIYPDDTHNESEELASICLEMKDENPDSVNRKTNEYYFAQLEKNRLKKGCKYSLLVTNLERGKPNDSPIYKAIGYENMYVVRPEYMMTFLNMITSLTTRFQNLIKTKGEEQLMLKTKLELIEKFNEIKMKYLDKPLASLSNSIDAIAKSNESIKAAANKIDEQCDRIKRNYINEIENKISRYEIEFSKGKFKTME